MKKYKKLLIPIMIISFLFTISSANAIDITLNPDDNGGINEAISKVNNNIDDINTITLNPGTYNKTTDRNNNITFNNKNLTIQGNGPAGSVIINAQKLGRIFNITGNSNIKFININFINGNSSGNGGTIYKIGSGALTIIDCTFNNSNANYGGAIYNTGSNFRIIDSDFYNNVARSREGGAIHTEGEENFTINNSNFINNTALGNNGCGGAITIRNTIYININNTVFTNNSANFCGGAIYNMWSEYITINNSTFTNNTAQHGGAFSINGDSYFEILNSRFIGNNVSGDGGAVEDNDNYLLKIINCSFENNTAKRGSAIYNLYSEETSVINSTFSNNSNASINLRGVNNSIIGCNFTNNQLAINITGNNISVVGCNVFNNNQGIFLSIAATNTTINYNRIFNNTNYDLNNTGINSNADYNWWGSSYTPNQLFDLIPSNYFIINIVNLTSLNSNGVVTFQYTFKLNDNSDSNASLLPYFVTNVYTNLTDGVYTSFDAKFSKTFDVILNDTGDILYTFVTDNGQQSFNGNISSKKILKTNITTNNMKSKNGKTITLTAKLTDENGNLLDGKEIVFNVGNITFKAITDDNGIATVQYVINKDDLIDEKLTFTVTFIENEDYLTSTNTEIIKLIKEPIPTPKPEDKDDNKDNNKSNDKNNDKTTNNSEKINKAIKNPKELNKTSAGMKKAGLPINLILLVLLTLIGITYYKKQ